MDIRNFFGKPGGAPAAAKKKSSNSTSNNNAKPKSSSSSNSKPTKSSKVAPAAAKKRDNDNDKKSPPRKQAPVDLMDSDEDEEVIVVRKKASSKKKVVLEEDSDSDATTDGEAVTNRKSKSKSNGKAAANNNKASDKDSDATKGAPEETAAPVSASKPKKKAAVEPPKRKEVSANDFFGSTSSSNNSSPKNKRSSPRQRGKPKQSTVVDWDEMEEEEEEEEETGKKTSKKNKDSDEDEDFEDVANDDDDNDEDLGADVDEEPAPSKKRSSSRAKAKTSVKKQKVKEEEDEGDDDDGEDDDFEEESKPVQPPSRNKRASAPKSPPAAKKRKTPASSAKKKKEKEPLLEPSLELESFSSDDAVPECLQDLTFVFSGILPNLSRDDSADFVKCLGARVTGAVSSKTSYLVVGEQLEDGRHYTEGQKYRTAKERGIHVVKGEKLLYGLAKLYSDKAKASQPAAADNGKENKQNQAPPAPTSGAVVNNPYAKKSTVVNPYAKKSTVANPYAKKPAAAANPYAKSATVKNESANNNVSVAKDGENALWVDRFAPTSTMEILGNKDKVIKLRNWLNVWEQKFNNDKAVGKSFSNPNGGPWKAALLSGPPGIGKTTSATLVAKEAGRDLIEFNASDVRSKKVMHNNMGDITGSQSVEGYFTNNKTNTKNNVRKRVVVMDEVDGMGGGDRGGMAELIQMIKHSRVPIICICNDRASQKMKSLLPYCLDLRFSRPIKTQIATAAMRIAHQEGLTVERNAAEAIAESCGNDIRQVLNCLQMWNSESGKTDKSMTYKSLKEREKEINKDNMLRVNLFDGAKLILEGRKGLAGADPEAERASFFKRNDAFFVDYSFTGLLVQQNYLKVMTPRFHEAVRSNEPSKVDGFLDSMHAAADSMSDFAMIENKIRGGSDMNWSLLPFAGAMAVKTGFHAAGPTGCGFPGFPEFTTWLGRNSSKGKKQRILGELKHHMNYKISGGTQEVRLSYLPFLRDRLLTQLKSSEENGNKDVIQIMDDYGLDRDDVYENMDEFIMNSKAPKFADIDSKSKAAFTREYNAGSHKSQALVDEQGAPKKTKKKGGSAAADPEDPDAIDDDVQAESSDDEEEEDIEKIKAAFKKKGRKAAGGTTKGGATKAATKAKGRKKK